MRRFALISRSVRWCLFLASSVAAAACAPPLQNGGVEVRTGAAERLGIVCRWRGGGASGEGLCGDMEEREPEQATPARDQGSAAPQDTTAGPLVAGRIGNLPIESGDVYPSEPAR